MPFGRPGGRVRIDPGRHHLRLGARDLTGSSSGVVSGATALTLGTTLSAVRFDPAGGHTPVGASYDSANGEINLPLGHWLITASVRLSVTFSGAASIIHAALGIQHSPSGGELRDNLVHGQTALVLPTDNPLSASLSVSGPVEITAATEDVVILCGVTSTGGSTTPTAIAIVAASVAAVQQLV